MARSAPRTDRSRLDRLTPVVFVFGVLLMVSAAALVDWRLGMAVLGFLLAVWALLVDA